MTGHHDTSLDALSRAVSEAADPQVMRLVAAVDALVAAAVAYLALRWRPRAALPESV